MLKIVRATVALLAGATAALADPKADCAQSVDRNLAIRACTELIAQQPADATLYTNRGNAYRMKGDHDLALADYTKAIEIYPHGTAAYTNRGISFMAKREFARALADFNKVVEFTPLSAPAYYNRGLAYKDTGDLERAVADHTKAIELNPRYGLAYSGRGAAHREAREFDRAIADYTKALDLGPPTEAGYVGRGIAHAAKAEFDKALADFNKAVELAPQSAPAYLNRGTAHKDAGDLARAIADYTKAIELNPRYAQAYINRGFALREKGEIDRALADYTKAIEIEPTNSMAYNNRAWAYLKASRPDQGLADAERALALQPSRAASLDTRAQIYEALGRKDDALADYRKLLSLPAAGAKEVQRQEIARERVARLTRSDPASGPQARGRVALVIGNSNYAHAGMLANPKNDARAVATAFRRLGFTDVMEIEDADFAAMNKALKNFGDRAEGADWAVVFFAGHGMEMNGTNYLVPIDAALARDSHVSDETISLDRVVAKVDAAKKLSVVILDACRNNPFVTRMVRTGGPTRSIGRGLARIEPEGNVIVAYSAKAGTVALDGSGVHSPYTEALLAHLEEPGLEIDRLFRKVRQSVRDKTARAQEPGHYAQLSSEDFFFRSAGTR